MRSCISLVAMAAICFVGVNASGSDAAQKTHPDQTQTNALAITPVIHGDRIVAIHLNSAIQQANWAYEIVEVAPEGAMQQGDPVVASFEIGGANNAGVQDAVVNLPVKQSSHKGYRLAIFALHNGATRSGVASTAAEIVTSDRFFHGLERYRASFFDHNHNIETWFDIHFKPKG